MTSGLGALPQFLRFLSMFPPADGLLSAAAGGPLAPFHLRTAQIWVMHENALVSIAAIGHTPDAAERYSVLPPEIDTQLWRAVRSNQVMITGESDRDDSAFATVDEAYWTSVLRRLEVVSVVRAPIAWQGEVVGILGLMAGRAWPRGDASDGILSAVTSALGLWITNPLSHAQERAAATYASRGARSLAFTTRQRDVLRMVEDGMANAAIASALQVSESSVKQDLQRAMQALSTSDRHAAATSARALGLLMEP
jgi:DNA-binding CsgD family transcriptional regulator